MTDLHPTVHHTDELRTNAEALRDLDRDEIARSDDPLTVFRNLYATVAALRNAWPALAEAAGFANVFEKDDIPFIETVPQALQTAADGLWAAQDAI